MALKALSTVFPPSYYWHGNGQPAV